MKRYYLNIVLTVSIATSGCASLALAQESGDVQAQPVADQFQRPTAAVKDPATRPNAKPKLAPLPLGQRTEKKEAVGAIKDQRAELKDKAQEQRTELKDKAKEQRAETKDKTADQRAELKEKFDSESAALKQKTEATKVIFEKNREELKMRLNAQKEELKNKREAEKAELKKRLETIRDAKKKETLERLDNKLNEINKKFVEHWLTALNRIEDLLGKVTVRADKAEAAGKDVSRVRTAVEKAKTALAAARVALEAQSAKTYTVAVTTEGALKNAGGEARSALNKDLKVAKDIVQAAHRAAVDALSPLKAVPKVDESASTPSAPVEPTSTQ